MSSISEGLDSARSYSSDQGEVVLAGAIEIQPATFPFIEGQLADLKREGYFYYSAHSIDAKPVYLLPSLVVDLARAIYRVGLYIILGICLAGHSVYKAYQDFKADQEELERNDSSPEGIHKRINKYKKELTQKIESLSGIKESDTKQKAAMEVFQILVERNRLVTSLAEEHRNSLIPIKLENLTEDTSIISYLREVYIISKIQAILDQTMLDLANNDNIVKKLEGLENGEEIPFSKEEIREVFTRYALENYGDLTPDVRGVLQEPGLGKFLGKAYREAYRKAYIISQIQTIFKSSDNNNIVKDLRGLNNKGTLFSKKLSKEKINKVFKEYVSENYDNLASDVRRALQESRRVTLREQAKAQLKHL